MIDAQAANETVRTGFSFVLDSATIGLIITNVFMLLKIKRSPSSVDRPGYTEKCIEHEKKLAHLEARQNINFENVKSIKDDLSDIRDKIDRVYLLIGGKVDKT